MGADFQGQVVPVVNESPVPVEIARQIQEITEGGAVVRTNDFLTFDNEMQKKAQTCIEDDSCILKLKHNFSADIFTKDQMPEVSKKSKNIDGAKAVAGTQNKKSKGFTAGPLSNRGLAGQLGQGPLGAGSRASMKGGSTVTYVVRKGDTLMEIAFDKYADFLKWRKIYRENRKKIVKPKLMQIGTKLAINNYKPVSISKKGKPYLIKKSDTLKSISLKLYGDEDKWKTIWKNNPELIRNPRKIYHGFTLYYEDVDSGSYQDRVPADKTTKR